MAKCLHVAVSEKEPCPIHWVDMGDWAGQRFCRVCQRHVAELSSLSAEEVAALLEQGGYVSLEYHADGSLVT